MKDLGFWIFASVFIICMTIMTLFGYGEVAAIISFLMGCVVAVIVFLKAIFGWLF